MTDTVEMQVPTINFDDAATAHSISIPDGHCAVALIDGDKPYQIDLPAGEHRLTGDSFVEFDAPFVVVVLPLQYGKVMARTDHVVSLKEATTH